MIIWKNDKSERIPFFGMDLLEGLFNRKSHLIASWEEWIEHNDFIEVEDIKEYELIKSELASKHFEMIEHCDSKEY